MSKETTLIIALRALDSNEEEFILQRSLTSEVILADSSNYTRNLINLKCAGRVTIDSIDSTMTDRALFDNVKKLAHRSFYNDLKLVDLLSYQDEFYPWFAIKSPLQKACLSAYQEFSTLSSLGNDWELSHHVIVFSNSDLSDCFPSKKVQFILSGESKKHSNNRKYFLVLLLRAFKGFFRPIRKHKHWLINSNLTRQKIYNLAGTHLIQGDPFLGYLEDEVGVDDGFQNLLMLKNPGAYILPPLAHCIAPYSNIKNHAFFESSLVSYRGWQSYNIAKKYKTDIQVNLGRALGNAQGFDRYLLRKLSAYAPTLMLSVIRYELAKKLIDKHKPNSVGGDDEFTLLKFPVFQAAKNAGIPTYAIQHGGISLNNINYSFVMEDSIYKPLPTKTMVWGEMTADQLTEKSIYSKDEIHLVGQLRTDVITALLSNKSERNKSEKKTIVFASQPLPHDPQLRRKMFDDFIELHRRFKEQNILWKPHPNERKDIPKFVADGRNKGVEIRVFEGDLYGLLANADALITNYSTVGSEAIYFDLELLILDYSANDSAGYVRNGVGHLCRNVNELEQAVDALIQNRKIVDPNNRQTYRERRAYKIDGRVRHRMIKLIKELKNE